MDEKTANPMKRAEIPSQPQGRCVICDDHLGVGNGYWRHVYAGTNPDGTGRMAHKNCWRNMRDQLWLSFGVSLDDLCDEELAIRQASRPKLGKPPIWTGDKALQEALNTLVAEVDPDTPEDIDEIIRSAGYDPNEVAARGQNLAARLIAEHTLTRVEAWEGRLEAIDNAVAIQCFDGNWNYNEYMRGLANGLLFAQAVMNDRDYEPLDVPENYVEQRPNVQGPFIRRKE